MKKTSLLVLTGYLLLTVVMTWPTARHLTNGIPGDGFDGWQNYWNLWWVKQALLVEQTSPFFTHYLDAPTGVSLLFHTLNIFNGLWTLPIQLAFGLAVAYNAVVFVSFALTGFGGYLLALYTLSHIYPRGRGRQAAAFVGGLVFTMSPFHMAHLLGHMQVFSMIWPPFYVLWLLKTVKPWQPPGHPPPTRPWRNAAICSLFLILATLVDWYHTLYLLLFTGLVLAWQLWRNRRYLASGRTRLARHDPDSQKSRHARGDSGGSPPLPLLSQILGRTGLANPFWRPIVIVLVMGIMFGVVLSPLLGPMLRDAGSRPDLETGLEQNISLSADLLAFVLPSEMHPLWGHWAKSIAADFTSTTSERLVFAGFVPLALGAIALLAGWKRRAIKFWALLLAAFTLMALGPYLHVRGQIVSLGGWPLPLPYLLLYYTVPFINLTRSLSRYDLMIMLCLGVLVSVGLVWLNARFRFKYANVLPLAAAGLVCFEFLAAPYPVSLIDTPQFYVDLSADPEPYTIAALPMNWDRPTPLLYQTTHGKRLLTAYTSRDNPRLLAPKTPVLQQWRYLGPDIIDQPLAQIAPTIFFDFDLRYIVLDYWQMPPGPERDATEKWVAAALPQATPVYDDGRLRVFKTPPKTETRPYLSLGQGWGDRVEDSSMITRKIQPGGAELFIHHPPLGQSLILEISAAAPPGQVLRLFADEQPVGTANLTTNFSAYTFMLPPVETSLLKLRLVPANPASEIVVRRITFTPQPQS